MLALGRGETERAVSPAGRAGSMEEISPCPGLARGVGLLGSDLQGRDHNRGLSSRYPAGGDTARVVMPTTRNVNVVWARDGKRFAYAQEGKLWIASVGPPCSPQRTKT